mmetsp:Transcript_16510/g.20030  ORF Transcript_16510/g.20030 Transcript_16510/m.20030 type:complete len:380 (-) Transcript_16510:162-1301(-)
MGRKNYTTTLHPAQIFQPVQFFIHDLDWREWISEKLQIVGHTWKIVLRQSEGIVGLHIVYCGPDSSVELYKIAYEVGTIDPVGRVKKGTLKFEVGKAIGFQEFTTQEKLESMFDEDGKCIVFLGVTSYAPEMQSLRKKVEKLTRERNSLHSSLQAMSVRDEDATTLNERFASQPEMVKSYEAFQSEMKFMLFEIMEKHGEKEFHLLMNELTNRIQIKVAKKYTERTKNIIELLNLDESATGSVSSALKRVMRQAGEFDRKKMSDGDKEAVDKIVSKSTFETDVKEFAKFVWLMTEYQSANTGLFVNWEAIGNEVSFNAAKHKSIERKIKEGEMCIIVLPMLTSASDFSNYNHDDDEDESDEEEDYDPPIVPAVVTVKTL